MYSLSTDAIYENGVLKSTPAGITSITVDPTATSIYGTGPKDYAFSGCHNDIQNVIFPVNSKLQSIQSFAFYMCTKLASIDLSKCTELTTIGEQAFFKCTTADLLVLPSSLNTIGIKCFYECTSIPSLDIPDSVASIGDAAFQKCSGITSCIIRDTSNIKYFNQRILSETSITEFNIPVGITSIAINSFEATYHMTKFTVSAGNTAFKAVDGVLFNFGMTKIIQCPVRNTKSYVLPDTVLTLGAVSFANSIIESIDLGTKLVKIENYVFQHSSLRSLSLPDSVTSAGTSLCYGCRSLTSIKLSSSLTSISETSFPYTAIESIVIPEGVKSIGKECFMNCANLKTVKFPSTLETCGGGIFTGCNKLDISFGENASLFVNNDLLLMKIDETEVLGCFGSQSTITIPQNVKNIKSSAFNSKSTITTVNFQSDNTLTTIEMRAFFNCENLQTISLPKSVVYIRKEAFSNCTKLTNVDFYPGLKSIEELAFAFCYSLTDAVFQNLNEGIQLKIEKSAFTHCTALKNAVLPEGLISVGQMFMYNCSSLKQLSLPSTLSSLGIDAFAYSGIEHFVIPESTGMTLITDSVFNKVTNLKDFTIPKDCTQLGSYALASTAISEITIPLSVIEIGSRCFSDCRYLKSFVVQTGNAQLSTLGDFLFENCHNLSIITCDNDHFISESNVLITKEKRDNLIAFPPASPIKFFSVPSTIKNIGPNAFYRCHNLRSVQIQDDSVKVISISAFQGCVNLVSINIPICVTDVGANAFKDCDNLNCGLFIENEDKEFRNKLKDIAKFPLKSLNDCAAIKTCKNDYNHPFINSLLLISFVLSC